MSAMRKDVRRKYPVERIQVNHSNGNGNGNGFQSQHNTSSSSVFTSFATTSGTTPTPSGISTPSLSPSPKPILPSQRTPSRTRDAQSAKRSSENDIVARSTSSLFGRRANKMSTVAPAPSTPRSSASTFLSTSASASPPTSSRESSYHPPEPEGADGETKKVKRNLVWTFVRKLQNKRPSTTRHLPTTSTRITTHDDDDERDSNAVIAITTSDYIDEAEGPNGNITLEQLLVRVGCIDLKAALAVHGLTTIAELRGLPLDAYTTLIPASEERDRLLTAIAQFYPHCRAVQEMRSRNRPVNAWGAEVNSTSSSYGASYVTEDVGESDAPHLFSPSRSHVGEATSSSSYTDEPQDRAALVDALTALGAAYLLPRLLGHGLCTPQAVLNCNESRLSQIIPQKKLRHDLVISLL
eukprot:PhM_4_TR15887/c0_g1_i3/m.16962